MLLAVRIVIAPDSFKGSLEADRAAAAIAVGVARSRPRGSGPSLVHSHSGSGPRAGTKSKDRPWPAAYGSVSVKRSRSGPTSRMVPAT